MGVMTMTRPTPRTVRDIPPALGPETAHLRDVMDELTLPDGYRAEIVNGEIVVSPAPCPCTT